MRTSSIYGIMLVAAAVSCAEPPGVNDAFHPSKKADQIIQDTRSAGAICEDLNSKCEYWSIIGQCEANPTWMKVNCRKSCNICGNGKKSDPDKCEDISTLCASAATGGDCERYANSMLWKCAKSCKACGADRECRNWDILCPTWHTMGECEKNPVWMKRFCPRACKECTGGTVPDCKNYRPDSDCDRWANSGECARNPGWMLYKCTKSCRVCGENKVCLDREKGCPEWTNQCHTNPLSHFNCRASCNLCQDNSGNTDDCKNLDFNCEWWAGRAECDKNPGFMLIYCARACRVCGSNQVCKDFHSNCDQWATKGDCDTNKGYMHLHCKKACKLCTDDGSTTTSQTTTTDNGRK